MAAGGKGGTGCHPTGADESARRAHSSALGAVAPESPPDRGGRSGGDDLLAAALRYAGYGWRVHPCRPGTKSPRFKWRQAATTSPSTIAAWWRQWPDGNIAICTGLGSLDVLDFDVAAGKPGMATLERLNAAGLLAGAIAVVRTPSGGWHYWFAGSAERNHSLPEFGLDLRAAGGMVIAPPSAVDGRAYEFVERRPPSGVTVDWAAVVELLCPDRRPPNPARARTGVRPFAASPDRRPANLDGLVRWVARQPEGARNDRLFWASCEALRQGASDTVLAELVAAAVAAGLDRRSAENSVQSARNTIHGRSR
ncbi:MAG TPA: bifunctional DNA primase/polymerase [Candidatus Limnocylindrales bacterium]